MTWCTPKFPIILPFGNVIRAFQKRHKKISRHDSSHNVQLNAIFVIKNNSGCRTAYGLTICFWLITLRCHTLCETTRHMYVWCRFSDDTSCVIYVFLLLFFLSSEVLPDSHAIRRKIIFYIWLVPQQQHQKRNSHLPTKRKHFINMLSAKSNHNIVSARQTFHHSKVITYRKFNARTFSEYAICFD